MKHAPSSRTAAARRVCVGGTVVRSAPAGGEVRGTREAGANRPLVLSGAARELPGLLDLRGLRALRGLRGLRGLRALLGLIRPSSAVPRARGMGGLPGHPVH